MVPALADAKGGLWFREEQWGKLEHWVKRKISSLLLETANNTLMKLTDDVQLGGVVSPIRAE